MTYVVAAETSPDQAGATLVFRPADGSVVPAGVVKGDCCPAGSTGKSPRYDLPRSTYTDFWTLLGPVTQTSSLLLHGTDYALDSELVMIDADGRQTVVGTVRSGTEVLAPGMTGGQFD